ncbi:hypothetical protein SHIRM173S_10475 [Streptomyces hirsutus]
MGLPALTFPASAPPHQVARCPTPTGQCLVGVGHLVAFFGCLCPSRQEILLHVSAPANSPNPSSRSKQNDHASGWHSRSDSHCRVILQEHGPTPGFNGKAPGPPDSPSTYGPRSLAPEQLHHSPMVGGRATRPSSDGKRPRFRKRKPGPMSSSRRFGASSGLSGATHSPPPWRVDREAETAWQEQRPRRLGRVESVAPCNHSAIDSEDDVIVPPATRRKGAGRLGTAQAFGARAASWNPPLPARPSARCRSVVGRPHPTPVADVPPYGRPRMPGPCPFRAPPSGNHGQRR